MFLWNVTQGPNLLDSCSRRSLLGNWCQRGRESTSKLKHIKGRGRLLSHPRCLVFKEERSHMSLRAERHVSRCFFVSFARIFFALIFNSLSSPIIQYQIQGEKEFISKGRKSLEFIAYLYPLGTCQYPNRVLSTHSLHVIPILVLLWFSQLALFSRCSCVI